MEFCSHFLFSTINEQISKIAQINAFCAFGIYNIKIVNFISSLLIIYFIYATAQHLNSYNLLLNHFLTFKTAAVLNCMK